MNNESQVKMGGGFLFATFQGEATPLSEQVYFALSQDGRDWRALHGGEPVLVSDVGECGARDPFLIRKVDGSGFILLATDLSINRHPSWKRAVEQGSRSILVWESPDLIQWTGPRLVAIAPEDAGCTWAPEAVYDPVARDYFVFWASTTRRDPEIKQRIWSSRTRDFRAFSAPEIFIDKPWHVIDTDIVHDQGLYYRFSKDEEHKTITMESSRDILGSWEKVPGFNLGHLPGYEGPLCFRMGGNVSSASRWCLMLDHYAEGKGYEAFVCEDLARGHFVAMQDLHFQFKMRHGGVLPVTAEERNRLVEHFVPAPFRSEKK